MWAEGKSREQASDGGSPDAWAISGKRRPSGRCAQRPLLCPSRPGRRPPHNAASVRPALCVLRRCSARGRAAGGGGARRAGRDGVGREPRRLGYLTSPSMIEMLLSLSGSQLLGTVLESTPPRAPPHMLAFRLCPSVVHHDLAIQPQTTSNKPSAAQAMLELPRVFHCSSLCGHHLSQRPGYAHTYTARTTAA